MPPEGTNLVLTSDIPDGERDVLVFNSLDVETLISRLSWHYRGRYGRRRHTDGWDSGHDLSELQLVQDSRFTGRIESNLPYYEAFTPCKGNSVEQSVPSGCLESFQRGQSSRVLERMSSMVTRTHFLLAEKARKEARDRETHC